MSDIVAKGYERTEGHVINHNDVELEKFYAERSRVMKEREMQTKIDSLEKEIRSIKRVLTEINNRIS